MTSRPRQFVRATLAFAIAAALVPSLASAKPLTQSVGKALAQIERDADAVASGRVSDRAIVDPARTIGMAWEKIEPKLVRNGDVLVETKMVNASITAFEADWKKPASARADAGRMKARIVDLIAAAKR